MGPGGREVCSGAGRLGLVALELPSHLGIEYGPAWWLSDRLVSNRLGGGDQRHGWCGETKRWREGRVQFSGPADGAGRALSPRIDHCLIVGGVPAHVRRWGRERQFHGWKTAVPKPSNAAAARACPFRAVQAL